MESEKVKEIKKALECCQTSKFDLLGEALTLINELEKCSEKWQKLCANEVALNTLLKERINELESENERLKSENQVLEDKDTLLAKVGELSKENQQLKDRIAELKKENENKTNTITDLLNKQQFYEIEKLKQFAKWLKEKFNRQEKRFATDVTRFENDLDQVKENDLPTAKFLIGKATGQATMAEKAQYYIDEILKEFINEK